MSELADFVVGYCHSVGGLVERPAFGVYDIVLPDDAAALLGVDPFLRVSFDATDDATAMRIGYGHPLVERIIEAVREQPACTRLAIATVRLDKRGLLALAAEALAFPNARLSAVPSALEHRVLFHYLKVNFKAAIVTDEKREQLIAVWMDVQSGQPADDIEALQVPRAAKPEQPDLPTAGLDWLPDHAPTSHAALDGLLERAAQAALVPLADDIARIEARGARYLELDRERLRQYFDDIEGDLTRRLERAADEERRAPLVAKLAAARAERVAKLADVAAKHRLRVELEPVNAALVEQPKLTLAVEIRNRHAAVQRQVVWDPLRHVLQPLTCDACRRPDAVLSLCAGGHLVCGDPACRAPQCVDCTRLYCRLCDAELGQCDVCAQPTCRRSLRRCPECGRSTCRAHAGACHGSDGAQRRASERSVAPTASPVTAPAAARAAAGAKARGSPVAVPPAAPRPAPAAKAGSGTRSKPPRKPAPPLRPPPRPVKPSNYSALRLDVVVEPDASVRGVVFHPRNRNTIASRVWHPTPEGIATFCACEKGEGCAAHGLLLRPADADSIVEQLTHAIHRLRDEYQVAPKRLDYLIRDARGDERRASVLKLGAPWTDPDALRAMQAAFDALVGNPRRRGPRSRG